MKSIFTTRFISDLNNPDKILSIFTCSISKYDNINQSNSVGRKTEVFLDTPTDVFNEDIFAIELDIESISNYEYLVDGVQLAPYNRLTLYYKYKLPNGEFSNSMEAGFIEINKDEFKLYDYAKNIIFINLCPFCINCKIELNKFKIDKDKEDTYGVIFSHKHNNIDKDPNNKSENLIYSSDYIINEIYKKFNNLNLNFNRSINRESVIYDFSNFKIKVSED